MKITQLLELFLIHLLVVFSLLLFGCTTKHTAVITPNQFQGSGTERIQAAINKAAETTGRVVIPANNSTDSGIWLIDSAIRLPSNISVILKNCTIQLSDKSRDNMFRSDNVGKGITNPEWNHDIRIIGIGDVLLKGAKNPRATGDAAKKLSLTPIKDVKKTGNYHISYGSDAGKEAVKQTGDWRNIMVLMAYVKGFILRNITIKNAHAWAISNERVVNAEISNIRLYSPPVSTIDSTKKFVRNRDGIDLRNGCKNFRINNIFGSTGDDFIALSLLQGLGDQDMETGSLNSTMVTSRKWRGPKDDIENIYIANIDAKSDTRAVAIRANSEASINHVIVNDITYKGPRNAILIGGRRYGPPTKPGKMNNIHAMNIVGGGNALIQIDAPIVNCSFTGCTYLGDGENIIRYHIDKSKTKNIVTHGIMINSN